MRKEPHAICGQLRSSVCREVAGRVSALAFGPRGPAQTVRPQRAQVLTQTPVMTTGLPGLWPMRKQRRRRIAALTHIGPAVFQ